MAETFEVNAEPTFEVGQEVAKIVKEGDEYFLIDNDGTKSDALKYCGNNATPVKEDNPATALVLVKNASCRQWFNLAKANKEIEEKGYVSLTYKPHRTIGSVRRLPNEKLISYLPEDVQAEYKAIIDRAIAAKEADKKKPMTDIEKAQAKLEKAKAAYEKLLAEAAGDAE